jgi:predicted Ser/Thr protein kinase
MPTHPQPAPAPPRPDVPLEPSLAGSSERPGAKQLASKDELIGAFKVVGEIARGGMGVVYRVRRTDSPTGAEHALKLMNDVALDPEGVARFQREMEVLGKVSGHPNVVRVVTSGVDVQGRPFYVMELLPPRSLYERVQKEGPIEPRELARIGVALARALAHCHAHGVVHRDLKPANVLVREDGTPVLTDFGLASIAAKRDNRLTRSHDILGTPIYMAPEQAIGRSIDPRSDIYGLGAILFTAGSGETPVATGAQIEVLQKVATGELRSLAKVAPNMPRALAHVIERALKTEPSHRYQTAEDMARALEVFLAGPDGTRADDEVADDAGPRRNLVPILLPLLLVELAVLGGLTPRALALRRENARAHAEHVRAKDVRELVLSRVAAASNVGPEAKLKLLEETSHELEGRGLDAAAVTSALADSLAPVVLEAFESRAKNRIARDPDAAGGIADLDVATSCARSMGSAGAPHLADLEALRADALYGRGDDEQGDAALVRAASVAPDALRRSELTARLARIRLARLEDPRDEIAAGSGEAALLAFERAIREGKASDAKLALGAVKDARGVSAAERQLAELALARLTGERSEVTLDSLHSSGDASKLEKARLLLAAAALEGASDAKNDLQDAIVETGSAGGRARVVRAEARAALIALLRRTGDLNAAAEAAKGSFEDAPRGRWRARLAVEAGRAAFASRDLPALRAALKAALGAAPDDRDVLALRGLAAREASRRGLARWTGRFVGGAEGIPFEPVFFGDERTFTDAKRRAARALGVREGALAEARARPSRDLRRILDIEGAIAYATESPGWKRAGPRGLIEDALAADEVPKELALARTRTARHAAEAVSVGRVAVDLCPDDPEVVRTQVDSLAETADADEAKALSERLEALQPDRPESRLALARAALATGDDRRAILFAGSVRRRDEEDAESLRILARAHLHKKDGPAFFEDLKKLTERSSYELSLLEPLEPALSTDTTSKVSIFAFGGAVGESAFDALKEQPEERRLLRHFMAWLAEERDFAWGAEHARETTRSFGPRELEATIAACTSLTGALWSDNELRCQVLWHRGLARLRAAAEPRDSVRGLLDLGEGLHALNDHALLFLARVADARARFPDMGELVGKDHGEEDGLWYGWESVPLIEASLLAASLQGGGSASKVQLERAIEETDEVLDQHRVSVPARVVRSFLLQHAGRKDEAVSDLACALAISPELDKPEDPSLLVWIPTELLDLAKKKNER